MRREPTAIGDLIRRVLGGLGLDDPTTWEALRRDWSELAGAPWDRLARPLSLRRGLLVVEAASPAAVGVLRYGLDGLRQRLESSLGEGTVREVELRPPPRSHLGDHRRID
ncbi:MAG: hypothetical protein KatS3mg011_2163 [Acidimicrobiia bacterium]|jgi:hypothetical protein|nr:MAG: hypothetical protein KatS3mg011_2163 [Acidimicrobiia bacterium]